MEEAVLEAIINCFKNEILTLTNEYNWYPEKFFITSDNKKVAINVPLPDHIPFPLNPMNPVDNPT